MPADSVILRYKCDRPGCDTVGQICVPIGKPHRIAGEITLYLTHEPMNWVRAKSDDFGGGTYCSPACLSQFLGEFIAQQDANQIIKDAQAKRKREAKEQ